MIIRACAEKRNGSSLCLVPLPPPVTGMLHISVECAAAMPGVVLSVAPVVISAVRDGCLETAHVYKLVDVTQ